MENKFTDYYRIGGLGGVKTGERQYKNDIQRCLCVNPTLKLIYYKPGKAAGTSIFRRILQPRGGWIIQKDNPKEFGEWVNNITDNELDTYFSFIFVRNPFSRLVSAWNDIHRPPHNNYPDFKKFVKNIIFNSESPIEIHYQVQSSLFEVPDGSKSHINFIGKVENMDSDWSELCKIINIPYVPMIHINHKKYEHYTSFYDKETIQLVSKIYERDLEIFGYKFEN